MQATSITITNSSTHPTAIRISMMCLVSPSTQLTLIWTSLELPFASFSDTMRLQYPPEGVVQNLGPGIKNSQQLLTIEKLMLKSCGYPVASGFWILNPALNSPSLLFWSRAQKLIVTDRNSPVEGTQLKQLVQLVIKKFVLSQTISQMQELTVSWQRQEALAGQASQLLQQDWANIRMGRNRIQKGIAMEISDNRTLDVIIRKI